MRAMTILRDGIWAGIKDAWKFLATNAYILGAGIAFQAWQGDGMAAGLFVIFSLFALRDGLEWAGRRLAMSVFEATAEHLKRVIKVGVDAEINVEQRPAGRAHGEKEGGGT